jgi:hypothetical protein
MPFFIISLNDVSQYMSLFHRFFCHTDVSACPRPLSRFIVSPCACPLAHHLLHRPKSLLMSTPTVLPQGVTLHKGPAPVIKLFKDVAQFNVNYNAFIVSALFPFLGGSAFHRHSVDVGCNALAGRSRLIINSRNCMQLSVAECCRLHVLLRVTTFIIFHKGSGA